LAATGVFPPAAAVPCGGKAGATRNKNRIETLAAGVARLDYDPDGCLDVFLVSGRKQVLHVVHADRILDLKEPGA